MSNEKPYSRYRLPLLKFVQHKYISDIWYILIQFYTNSFLLSRFVRYIDVQLQDSRHDNIAAVIICMIKRCSKYSYQIFYWKLEEIQIIAFLSGEKNRADM